MATDNQFHRIYEVTSSVVSAMISISDQAQNNVRKSMLRKALGLRR